MGLDFADFQETNAPKAQTPIIHKTFCILLYFNNLTFAEQRTRRSRCKSRDSTKTEVKKWLTIADQDILSAIVSHRIRVNYAMKSAILAHNLHFWFL